MIEVEMKGKFGDRKGVKTINRVSKEDLVRYSRLWDAIAGSEQIKDKLGIPDFKIHVMPLTDPIASGNSQNEKGWIFAQYAMTLYGYTHRLLAAYRRMYQLEVKIERVFDDNSMHYYCEIVVSNVERHTSEHRDHVEALIWALRTLRGIAVNL